jgi:hemoglobin/transferrin/lactoferrin receptor protein
VGSARLLYRAIPNRLNLFTGVSQAFRAPNLSDLTRFDTARSGEIEIPATNLDPEKFVTFEVGAKWAENNLTAEASVFYTDISDQIVLFPTGTIIDGEPAITRDNIGDGWVSGVEFGLSYEFYPAWTLFGNTTFQQGEMDTFRTAAPIISRDYLSRTMPWMGRVGLRWEGDTTPVWAEIMGVFAADADKLSTRDQADTQRIPTGGTPGFALLDLRAGWAINDHLQLIAAIDNITDENYRVHGSGQNSPGRSFILSATASF